MAYNFDDSDFEDLQNEVENLEEQIRELERDNSDLRNEVEWLEDNRVSNEDLNKLDSIDKFESKLREVRIWLDNYPKICEVEDKEIKDLADSIVDLFKEYEISL